MKLDRRRHGWLLVGVLAAALALRCAAAVVWQQQLEGRFRFGDSDSYWVLAQSIVRGDPYEYGGPTARVFRMPGYPLLLAGWFTVLGDDDPPVLSVRLLGAALGTLTVGFVYLLGKQIGGSRLGLLAAALCTVYPGAIATSIVVLSEPAFCPLLVAQLTLFVAAGRTSAARDAVLLCALAGALGGAATLMRPSWLLFTPLAALMLISCDGQRRRRIMQGVAVIVALVVVITPWWIRNYSVTGRFVPTTLQVGASLYDGLHPGADGSSDMAFLPNARREVRRAIGDVDRAEFEYRLDRHLRNAALDWAFAHPGDAAQLAGTKFLRLWNVWPNAEEFSSFPLRAVTAVGYLPLIVLGGFALWRGPRCRGGWWVCWLPVLYFTALHVVFVSSLRYREPAMLAWIVLAAAAVVHLGAANDTSRSLTEQRGS